MRKEASRDALEIQENAHRRTLAVSKHLFLSAWGFILAAASTLFLWVGSLLDQLLGTAPLLMLGLFFLAVVGCFIELFDEVRKMLKRK